MKEDILKLLAEIQGRVRESLVKASQELCSMGESVRGELKKLYARKDELIVEIDRVIKEVDKAQEEFNRAKERIVEVRQDFSKYSERDIKEAYDLAERKSMELFRLREREKLLRKERDFVDMRIRELEGIVGKIDDLSKKISVAIDLLTGNLDKVEREIVELRGRAELAPFMIQVLEKERKKIARDIHDGPAQYLANVVLRLEVCEKFLEKGDIDKLLEEIKNMKDLVKSNLSDVRRFISDLRPILIEDIGLIPALRKYVEDWERLSRVKVEFRALGEEKGIENKDIEIALFRIVQEALSNVHKHAKASYVRVIIEVGDDFVGAMIQDNGIGFDLVEAKKLSLEKGSLGIFSMEERAKALGGTIRIHSEKEKGTKIIVRIPKEGGIV